MSDTARSLSALLTIFADGQSKGAITPQDVRDLIVSLQASYGGMEITVPAETTIETAGVPVKMAGTTSFVSPTNNFTMPVSNRLTYTGTVARDFLITANGSFTVAANNQIIALTSGKNGTPSNARSRIKLGTGGDLNEVSGHRIITLEPNDYVEVFAINETSDANITVVNLSYYITSLFG